MSTKAELQNQINASLPSGSSILAEDHRGVLKDDTHNVVDNVYSDVTIDTHLTSNIISIVTGVFTAEYEFKIFKIGNTVFLSGFLTCLTGTLVRFASINLQEYQPIITNDFTVPPFSNANPTPFVSVGTVSFNSGSVPLTDYKTVGVYGNGTQGAVVVKEGLQSGETIRFEITYNTI